MLVALNATFMWQTMVFLSWPFCGENDFLCDLVIFCCVFRCEYEKNILNLHRKHEEVNYEIALLPSVVYCSCSVLGGL